jgi:hypothetical protein
LGERKRAKRGGLRQQVFQEKEMIGLFNFLHRGVSVLTKGSETRSVGYFEPLVFLRWALPGETEVLGVLKLLPHWFKFCFSPSRVGSLSCNRASGIPPFSSKAVVICKTKRRVSPV